MDSLEELEQRKKELLLRKEVKKLEAQERRGEKVAKFASWWVIGPMGLIGLWLTIGGISAEPGLLVVGVPALAGAVYLAMQRTGSGAN